MWYQMTVRTDNSDFGRYSPAYVTGREFGNADGIAQLSSKDEMSCFSFLENLYIDPEPYLAPIKKVEVSYV